MTDFGEKVGFGRGRPLGLAPGIDQFLLGALPLRDVAEYAAEFRRLVGDAAHGHEQRDQATLAHAADHLAAVVEDAGDTASRQPVEVVERFAAAFGRKQVSEGAAVEFARVESEQCLGASVGCHDLPACIGDDHAVGGSVENRCELARVRFGGAQGGLDLPVPIVGCCLVEHQQQRSLGFPSRP